MNKLVIFIIIIFCGSLSSQSLEGAWEKYETKSNGIVERHVTIYTNGFFSSIVYDNLNGRFISTNGGSWFLDGKVLSKEIEFDTNNFEKVGSSVILDSEMKKNTNTMKLAGETWNRIDDGEPGKLNGAWLMSGRYRDGIKSTRNIDRPRKTMKILSGTRFQWIAYNTETKQFMGTGGGTYKTIDGKYTEQIEFFSRDNSRVGAELSFEFKLNDGEWNHMGNSSRGVPIHEIWTKRK